LWIARSLFRLPSGSACRSTTLTPMTRRRLRRWRNCWPACPTPAAWFSPTPPNEAFCRETEALLREAADAGDVVVLGRAGALVLRDRPGALHVRLDGPEEARLAQAMRVEGIDEEEARQRQRNSDRARTAYVKHFYGADPCNPDHYHLVLDSTALPIETCVELIVTAARAGAPAG